MTQMLDPSDAPTPEGTPGHSEIAQFRRDQVIDAAIEIIATQGIHRLTLGNIEERVKMARGHLTYYFPTKEDILLAVFDRMLERMIAEALAAEGPKPGSGQAWTCVQQMFARTLEPTTPEKDAFHSLIHTFLAQIAYRPDFREKIAGANSHWREAMANDYAQSVPEPVAPPPIVASILMALVQGLGGQLAVDPQAFDRQEMARALAQLLAPFFGTVQDHPAGNRP